VFKALDPKPGTLIPELCNRASRPELELNSEKPAPNPKEELLNPEMLLHV